MSLPLIERAGSEDVRFVLSRQLPRAAQPILHQIEPPAHVPRIPGRTPSPGEQYRFHFDMTQCIGCKCCVVACNEQNGNPADFNRRRVGEIEGGCTRVEDGVVFFALCSAHTVAEPNHEPELPVMCVQSGTTAPIHYYSSGEA